MNTYQFELKQKFAGYIIVSGPASIRSYKNKTTTSLLMKIVLMKYDLSLVYFENNHA